MNEVFGLLRSEEWLRLAFAQLQRVRIVREKFKQTSEWIEVRLSAVMVCLSSLSWMLNNRSFDIGMLMALIFIYCVILFKEIVLWHCGEWMHIWYILHHILSIAITVLIVTKTFNLDSDVCTTNGCRTMLLGLILFAGVVGMFSYTVVMVRLFLAIVCNVWQFSTSCFLFQICYQHWIICDFSIILLAMLILLLAVGNLWRLLSALERRLMMKVQSIVV